MSTPSQFVFFEQHTCGLWGEHTETCDSNTEFCTLVMRQQVNHKLTKTKVGMKTRPKTKTKTRTNTKTGTVKKTHGDVRLKHRVLHSGQEAEGEPQTYKNKGRNEDKAKEKDKYKDEDKYLDRDSNKDI